MIEPDRESEWEYVCENYRGIIAGYLEGLKDTDLADVMFELMQDKRFETAVIEAFRDSKLWDDVAKAALENRMEDTRDIEDMPGSDR